MKKQNVKAVKTSKKVSAKRTKKVVTVDTAHSVSSVKIDGKKVGLEQYLEVKSEMEGLFTFKLGDQVAFNHKKLNRRIAATLHSIGKNEVVIIDMIEGKTFYVAKSAVEVL